VKELPGGPALLSAGSQRRPDASAPLPGQGQYSILDFEHNPVESVLWDFVSKMPDMKEPLELNEQAISKAFVGLIGQSRKKFDVPNQVGQAELLNLRLFDWLTTAYIAAVATISVKRDRLVNLILPE